jgi:pentatricopeptide repeat protein
MKIANAKNENKNSYGRGKTLGVLIIILSILAFIIYSNTFNSPFVFDDYRSIVLSDSIRDNSIFTKFNAQRYVALLTFAINYKINGLEVKWYHIINVVIHLINALLVFMLVERVLRLMGEASGRLISIITAIVFLAHPIQTQSVTYIVQREASLAALFAITSILFYIAYRESGDKVYSFYILSLICALLAYKTKENTASLPLIIFLLEIILFRKQLSIKKIIVHALPYALLIIVIPLSLIKVSEMDGKLLNNIDEVLAETESISRGVYFYTQQKVLLTYIRLILLPYKQAFDYYFPLSNSLFEFKTFLCFLFNAGLIVGAVLLIKRLPVVSFGVMWFYIFLIIESTFFPIRDVIWEHRIYLPSVGFILSVIYILYLINEKTRIKLFLPICIVIILIFSYATYERNKVWKDDLTLFKDSVEKHPQKARNHFSLGSAYMRRGMNDEAIKELQEALRLDDNMVGARVNLAICYLARRELERARQEFIKVLKQRPGYPLASYKLALIYMEKGEIDAAFDTLIEAKKVAPMYTKVNALLADIYCKRGDFNKAIELFSLAEKVGLYVSELYYNFGLCLMKNSKINESRRYLLKSVELDPNNLIAYYAIALGYEGEGNYVQAMNYLRLFLEKSTGQTSYTIDARWRLRMLEAKVNRR